MFAKLALPAIAIAALAGCVTDDGYGGGYYYSQPRIEYRTYDPYGYGYYGGTYGYGSYDYYGGIGYGSSRGYYGGIGYGYYGSPGYYYGYGGYWQRPYATYPPHWYRPHPPRPDGGTPQPPPDDGDDRANNLPPWRNIGRLPTPELPRRTAQPQALPQYIPHGEPRIPAQRVQPQVAQPAQRFERAPAPRMQAPESRPMRIAPAQREARPAPMRQARRAEQQD
ncbi:MAG: hypothetical protein QM612_11410 [Thermomonas sp.]|uniref:hypothetical protein n=1 Tax=Thermomonas sp. TaxID=1971895 RepID=UPI0039E6A30B